MTRVKGKGKGKGKGSGRFGKGGKDATKSDVPTVAHTTIAIGLEKARLPCPGRVRVVK